MNVALIGPGQIGIDLLYKIKRSPVLKCVVVAGRNLAGKGLTKAHSMGFNVIANGIDGLVDLKEEYSLVFDATDANSHKAHWEILKELNKKVIDLTPSSVGSMLIPDSVNLSSTILRSGNINLISCGGQATIPILEALSKEYNSIKYIEIITTASSQSVGRATRLNIDEYINTTQAAVRQYTNVQNIKVMLNLSAAVPPVPFRVIMHIIGDNLDIEMIKKVSKKIEQNVQKYAPGYKILTAEKISESHVYLSVEVDGLGDYLPTYSGNLDMINCAAIYMAEKIAYFDIPTK